MKTKEIDLKYAKLHLIKTKDFRSINIKVLLKDEIRKEDITKRNFLAEYLILTTKKYKTRQELSLKIQELYSLFLSAYNTRIGNYLITKFNLSMLDPKYTESCMLNDSIDLLSEVIFNPNQKNGKFDSNSFNIVKRGILNEIKTLKENPKDYDNIKMFENMDKNAPYSYNGYGYLEDLEKIDEKNLYEYYKDFIKTASVDIYVIGNFDEKEMIRIIKEKLNFKTLKKEKKDIYVKNNINKEKTIIEKDKFNQSKLAIGCKLKDLTDFERKYVINMYNMILGGGFNSKFMQEIREKNSLAYYINSSILKADNILLIQSGISANNFKKVISSIKKIMKEMEHGNIKESELENSKTEYLSLLDEINDSIDSILENKIATSLLNLDEFSVRKEKMKEVTIKDISNLAKKVHIDTIYLLEDGGNNEEI
mgnify:FL=1